MNGPTDPKRWEHRHPSTQHMMKMLIPNPNLREPMFTISNDFYDHAADLTQDLPDSPELTAGLRKFLEAKDCFIRAMVDNSPVDYRDR